MKTLLRTTILFAFLVVFFGCTTGENNSLEEVESLDLEYKIENETKGKLDCESCLELNFSLEQIFDIGLCGYNFDVSIVENPADCPYSPGTNTIFTPVSATWNFGDKTGNLTIQGWDALSTTHFYQGGDCPEAGTIVTVNMVFNIFDPFASGGPDLGECNRTMSHTFVF